MVDDYFVSSAIDAEIVWMKIKLHGPKYADDYKLLSEYFELSSGSALHAHTPWRFLQSPHF